MADLTSCVLIGKGHSSCIQPTGSVADVDAISANAFERQSGDYLMSLLYSGQEYRGYGHVISVLAFATVVWATGMPPANALAAMQRRCPAAVVAAISADRIFAK